MYAHQGHEGSITDLKGTPGPLYHALKSYNREFAAIARELQPLRSLAVHHTAMRERGCEPLPADAPFRHEGGAPAAPTRGFLLGTFGPKQKATHAMAVNLDYRSGARATLVGPGRLEVFEVFDESKGRWIAAKKPRVELDLPPGGGKLIRMR